jgi:hypothetical protein
LKAPLNSPALTGIPTAVTPPSTDNSLAIATTAFVNGQILSNATLDATTTQKGKVQLAGDLTGSADLPRVAANAITNAKLANDAVNTAKIEDGTIIDADISATANIAQAKINNLTNDLSLKAPLNSPALTGIPTAVTPPSTDNSLAIATTAFVANALLPKIYTKGLFYSELGGVVVHVTDGGKHGLVAAAQDQGKWMGIDAENEISKEGNHDIDGRKFTDWRLPTRHELKLVYDQRANIGTYDNIDSYWSSTFKDVGRFYIRQFSSTDITGDRDWDDLANVRAVRSF